jgi:hypothetical protein
MSDTISLGEIRRVVLFGGAPLLVGTVRSLREAGTEVHVYTSPRHLAELLDSDGTTLAASLDALGQHYVSTEDINAETGLRDLVDEHTLGIGMGEAWSFDSALIETFGGRLLDFMGIPHPRYRGGAHYTWMIMRGDREGACNLQVINEQMVQGEFDSGAILKSRSYRFPDSARTPADYFAAAVPQEVGFIREFLAEVDAGASFELRLPDESASLLLPRLNTIENGWVDWSWTGKDIERFICAFDDPYVGASTTVGGRRVHLKRVRLDASEAPFHPYESGLITRIHDGVAAVATTSGHLLVESIRDGGGDNVLDDLRPGMRLFTPGEQCARAATHSPDYGAAL